MKSKRTKPKAEQIQFRNCQGETVSLSADMTVKQLVLAGIRKISLQPLNAPKPKDKRIYWHPI